MVSPFDRYPEFFVRQQSDSLDEWQRPTAQSAHRARLAHDAGGNRQPSRLVHASPVTARFSLDLGALLVKVGCRLERAGFSRLGAQSASSTLSVDCGCA
jgi:hypothetical protein